jgi:hypothetical protein
MGVYRTNMPPLFKTQPIEGQIPQRAKAYRRFKSRIKINLAVIG